MGDAFLTRRGGASLRRLELISPPDKLRYFAGEYLDMTGTIVGANFGAFTVPLHDTAWQYSPLRALTASDQAIQITATLGRLTRQLSVPIAVEDYNTVFSENSWNTIARVAAYGIAGQAWNLGDSKTIEVDGTQLEARIVSFIADPLSPNDEMYNNSSYNGNTKRAAMVMQFFTSPGTAPMHTSASETGWDTCTMRTNVMASLYNKLPADLKAAIRLVTKYSFNGRQSRNITTADRLFLQSEFEVKVPTERLNREFERDNCILYDYFNGRAPAHAQQNWTRSMDDAGCTVLNHYFALQANGNTDLNATYSRELNYYPMFCL